jgi:hypothetical protein
MVVSKRLSISGARRAFGFRLVYGTLLLVAAKCISDGSELLLEILDPGIIGGLVRHCRDDTLLR